MAIQVKVGTFTAPAATGNQNVSWTNGGKWPASATPELVFLFSTGQTAAGTVNAANHLLGAFNATQQCSFASFSDGPLATQSNSGQSARTTTAIVILSNGTPTVLSVASPGATRFASNQFSLNWTTVGAGTSGMIFGYIALSGLSETWIGALRSPTASGAQTTPVLGSGARWDAAIFIPSWHNTGAGVLTDGTTTQTFARTNIGFAAYNGGTIQQFATLYHDNDGEASMDATVGLVSTRCLLMPANPTNASNAPPQASLTTFNADGTLTFSWTNASTTANKAFLGILLRGVEARVGTTLQPAVTTADTDVQVTGLGVTPLAVLLTATSQTAEGTLVSSMPNNATAQWAFGASDATANVAITNMQQDAAPESQSRRTLSTTAAIAINKYNAAAAAGVTTAVVTAGTAVLQAVGSGTFTLRHNGQDATQRRIGYLALAAAAGGDATLTAQVTAATAASPNATLAAASSFAAQAAAATATAPNASIAAASTLGAQAATATAASPDATLSAAGAATLSAQVAGATASSPNGALAAWSVLAGTTAPASASSPSAVLTASSVLAGAVAAATAQSPTAAVHGAAALLAALTTATAASPASTWTASSVLTAVVASALANSPNATVSAASAVTKVVRMTLRTRNRSLTLAAIDTSLTLPTRARRP